MPWCVVCLEILEVAQFLQSHGVPVDSQAFGQGMFSWMFLTNLVLGSSNSFVVLHNLISLYIYMSLPAGTWELGALQ